MLLVLVFGKQIFIHSFIPFVTPANDCNLPVCEQFAPRRCTTLPLPGISGVARFCCEEGQRWKLCHGALTVDFRAGWSSCSMTNSFMINAVLIERAVMSCWHLHQLISQTTQYLAVRFTPNWTKNEIVESQGGHVPQCPIAGDATARNWIRLVKAPLSTVSSTNVAKSWQ